MKTKITLVGGGPAGRPAFVHVRLRVQSSLVGPLVRTVRSD